MRRKTLALTLVLGLAPLSGVAVAEQVYKSTDEAGNIIYSDRPIPDAVSTEEVAIEPGPSEERVKEAQERLEQANQFAREMADELAEKRKAREEKRRETEERSEKTRVEPEEGSSRTMIWYPGYFWRPHRPFPPRHPRRPHRPRPPGHPGWGDRPGFGPDTPPAYPAPPIARPLPEHVR